MTVEFYIVSFSESKMTESINKKYLVCYCNKKHNFYGADLELSEKSNCLCC